MDESDKIIIQKAYGYADLPNKVRNKYDTKFATASAGKVFVAVGILQLIEKELLHFEDTIGEILDFDWLNRFAIMIISWRGLLNNEIDNSKYKCLME